MVGDWMVEEVVDFGGGHLDLIWAIGVALYYRTRVKVGRVCGVSCVERFGGEVA